MHRLMHVRTRKGLQFTITTCGAEQASKGMQLLLILVRTAGPIDKQAT